VIVTVLTGISCLVTGAGIAGTTVYRHMRKRICPEQRDYELTKADRSGIADEFAVHVSAVQQKVSEFADALADGDLQLRDRLRFFENGGDQS
jgi:hypothetical protein